MDVKLNENPPRVILIFEDSKLKKGLENEYGANAIRKLMIGAAEEASPDQEVIRIQLPAGKDDPLVSLAVMGEREMFKVAIFTRGAHIRESNLIEFIFRRVESAAVDEDATHEKALKFRPNLRYGR